MEDIWSELITHDTNNEMIFFNTEISTDGSEFNACGLVTGHSYVVLTAKELSNGDRLVKVRNPWGEEGYNCAYSDESQRWTPELREEAGAKATPEDDGIFFMTIEDYYNQGLVTIISFDTTDWFEDHFLMLDDKTTPNGEWEFCGPTCTRHIIEVTSSVAQDVYVTVHTWESRSYPREC